MTQVKLNLSKLEILKVLRPLQLFESHDSVFSVFRSHPELAEWRAYLPIMQCRSPNEVLVAVVDFLLDEGSVKAGRPGLLFFLDAIEATYPFVVTDLKLRLLEA